MIVIGFSCHVNKVAQNYFTPYRSSLNAIVTENVHLTQLCRYGNSAINENGTVEIMGKKYSWS